MRAIVLKNHYEPTASLAYIVRKEVPGIEIFGGISLDLTVGGVNPAIHPAGTALLERVCATRSVAVFGYGAEALPGSSPILRNYKGEAWGLEMYRALAAAKIALNRHIDVAEGHANNMRLYEATGMGAALLTEPAPNLAELFEPDREVATYDNADHLLTQIDRLLGLPVSIGPLSYRG